MKKMRWGVRASLVAMCAAILPLASVTPANASSAYDGLIQVTPTLIVYTDGGTKSQTMDISETWFEEYKAAYAKRIAQGIGWNTTFATELDYIMNNGGSWGIFTQETVDGKLVNIVGTRDPSADCEFVGSATTGTLDCFSHSGYGFARAEYYTHSSYGGNGCIGSGQDRCSDTGMGIYDSPVVQTGTAGYIFTSIPLSVISDYEFFVMENFNLVNKPMGYAGQDLPINPPSATYVAMGDSYSSGEGNPPFEAPTGVDSTNECHRSPGAWPRQLQQRLNLGPMAFTACSGATTQNVLYGGSGTGGWSEGPQIDKLTSDTDVVTITVGGNDVGFKAYTESCHAIDPDCGPSSQSYTDIMDEILDPGFYSNLYDTYETILAEAPNAEVYVLDYPYIAADDAGTCGLVDLSGAWLVQEALNNVISLAVDELVVMEEQTRLHYVDTNYEGSPFEGQHICNGGATDFHTFTFPDVEYSYHPNTSGQDHYADVAEDAIN